MKCFICGEETDWETTNNQPICLSCAEKRGYVACNELGKVIDDSTFSCDHICNDCCLINK